jgi:CopG family nickel-responsive transcriptional regulator
MERFTVSLEGDLLAAFDRFIERRGYANRSEAVRDLLRRHLADERLEGDSGGDCVACLSYVYNHHERELARRMVAAQHDSHDLVRATLHVHLDHENCLEVAILQGPTAAVRRFAQQMTAETGVRHGHLSAVPVEREATDRHRHAHGGARPHEHMHPKL